MILLKKIINNITKEFKMVYSVSTAFIVSHVCDDFTKNLLLTSEDEKYKNLINFKKRQIKDVGLSNWLKKNGTSLDSMRKYFTAIVNTMHPITNIAINDI